MKRIRESEHTNMNENTMNIYEGDQDEIETSYGR